SDLAAAARGREADPLDERRRIHSAAAARGREADPLDERRRIHFAAAEDPSGGSRGCAASTPWLNGAASEARLIRAQRAGVPGGAPLAPPGSMMDKIDVQWRCEVCHEEAVTVAWRGRSEDLEPVMVRTKCPICGNVSTRSFRPGTLADTEETYTLDEWLK